NLERSARSYAALLTPDHDAWADLGVDAQIDVESLLRLRIEQNRPLLLAAIENFEPSELKKLLRYLVAWSVRGIVVGGIGAGKSESAYANAATEVTEGNATTVAEVYEQLREIIPSDDRFRSSFASYSPPTNKMARYYLLAFEKAQRGDEEPELIPNEDEETVNLEHVLPRSPRQNDWPEFRPEEVKEWSGRIGNLVLLRRSANIRLGNRSFATKQPILVASDLIVTRTVGEREVWTKEEIERRAVELAELAVSVWPRQP
ncbi:MAG: HNH endonuclease family protein, partial [Actinobacteria bacterium]|nr:HNH endonuclease family protein [Actinomycetota bacterium]